MQFIRSSNLIRSSFLFSKNVSFPKLIFKFENSIKYNCQRTREYYAPVSRNFYTKSFINNILRRNVSQKSGKENVRSSRKYSKAEIERLFNLAKPEKWKLTGAICLLIVSSTVTMAVPFSLGKIIDVICIKDPKRMKENLRTLAKVLIGVFILGGLCNFGRVFLISVAGQNITRTLRHKVFNSIMNQELAFFDKNKTGELVNRLSADTSLVSHALTNNISDGLRSGVMVLAGVSIMFYMSPELTAVGLSIVPPVAAMGILYGRYVKKITKEVQDSLASATSVAEEKISNIRTVKAFANEDREVEIYDDKLHNIRRLAYKEALARGAFFGMTGLSGNIIILSVLYYGSVLVSESTMTIGNLTSFLLYAAYIGISISGLSNFYSELNKSLGASVRLWEIIDRVPRIPIHGGLIPENIPRGCITFKDVTFSYPTRKGSPVLRNLNLEIPEATVTAIVGSSGSGKSTIASILLRLYDPDEGQILLDGVNIDKINIEWIRRNVGFVSQEPILFSGSIRENILYGAEDPSCVTDDEIIQAAKEAKCYDFITKTFAQGFETKVGERGIMLSGGQKQRVAIARALIKNPKILLLDEATSALDAESEHLVQESLEKIMKGRTVLIIAHRLSSIRNSDQIIVLEKGQVVEIGNYEKLMQLEEGAFRKLIKHQAFS